MRNVRVGATPLVRCTKSMWGLCSFNRRVLGLQVALYGVVSDGVAACLGEGVLSCFRIWKFTSICARVHWTCAGSRDVQNEQESWSAVGVHQTIVYKDSFWLVNEGWHPESKLLDVHFFIVNLSWQIYLDQALDKAKYGLESPPPNTYNVPSAIGRQVRVLL